MRPPLAIARRVRIPSLVGVFVMHSMDCDPVDRPALERKRSADCDAILQPFRNRVASVGKQAVITHCDSNVLCQNPYRDKHNDGRPTEAEQSSYCTQMKTHQGNCKNPIDSASNGLRVKTRGLKDCVSG